MELVLGFVVWTLIVALFFVGCYRSGKGSSEPFERRFPPISDEEFVARCTPGTDPAVALRVRKIVAYHTGVEYERIYPLVTVRR